MIKPTFVRHVVEEPEQQCDNVAEHLAPQLTRAGYFTRPSVLDMSSMSETELMQIDNFEVCREGFGSIKWLGVTDVRGLDLDELVDIGKGAVTVCPDGNRAPVGTQLNKSAVICLKVQRTASSQDEAARLKKRIQQLTEKAGHKFISYDLDTWIFSVTDFEA